MSKPLFDVIEAMRRKTNDLRNHAYDRARDDGAALVEIEVLTKWLADPHRGVRLTGEEPTKVGALLCKCIEHTIAEYIEDELERLESR